MEFSEFAQLDDEQAFVAIVTNHYENAFAEVTDLAECSPVIELSRVGVSYNEYKQSINRFAVLLDSENPDHYKRSGALLYSLYLTDPIVDILVKGTPLSELEGHTALGMSYADEEYKLGFVSTFAEYANEMMAFDLAFGCCDVYEPDTHEYDYDFLHNMAYYMKQNSSLSVASFAMIFKAYMA